MCDLFNHFVCGSLGRATGWLLLTGPPCWKTSDLLSETDPFPETSYLKEAKKLDSVNPLTPNDLYMSRTARVTSKRCILYIYPTNVGTEYFKHALYSPFFFSSKCSLFHNANLFGFCIIRILYTGVLKLKKK